MKKFANLLIVFCTTAVLSLLLTNCKKVALQESTTSDPNILQYLQELLQPIQHPYLMHQ